MYEHTPLPPTWYSIKLMIVMIMMIMLFTMIMKMITIVLMTMIDVLSGLAISTYLELFQTMKLRQRLQSCLTQFYEQLKSEYTF